MIVIFNPVMLFVIKDSNGIMEICHLKTRKCSIASKHNCETYQSGDTKKRPLCLFTRDA